MSKASMQRDAILLRRGMLLAAAVGGLNGCPKPAPQVCLARMVSPCEGAEILGHLRYGPEEARVRG